MKKQQGKAKARANRIARKRAIKWKLDMTGDAESPMRDAMRATRRNYRAGKSA